MSDPEKTISMEIPESAVASVQDFLEKRKSGNKAGLILGVQLPDFGDGNTNTWAVYELAERRWVFLSEKQ